MADVILLIQETSDPASRLWESYENVNSAVKGIVSFFEDEVRFNSKTAKKRGGGGGGGNHGQLDYSVQDLLDYMDSLNELVCLVLDGKTGAFVPQTRDFLKKRAQQFLLKQGQ